MTSAVWLLTAVPYRYMSMGLVRPTWVPGKRVLHVIEAVWKFGIYRIQTLLFLLFGWMPYKKTIWYGKPVLDRALAKGGAVLITVHSGPYPLGGKAFFDAYPDTPLVAPFFWRSKISSFQLFRRLFRKLGITIVALGGAMKQIGPIIEKGGAVLLCMDAALPVKRTAPVTMFGKSGIRLTTGPLWIAKTYGVPIIPMYVREEVGQLQMHILKPIPVTGKPDMEVMDSIAGAVESMIEKTLDQWQTMDEFFYYKSPIEN